MNTLRIGVVGYSGQKFDEDEARRLLESALDDAVSEHPGAQRIVVVSGLTDLGIPALAYRIATARGWQTAGVALRWLSSTTASRSTIV